MVTFTVLLTAVVLLSPSVPAYEPEGCNRLRPSQVVYTALRRALRHTRPVVDDERVEGLWRCTTTRAKAHEAHRRAARWRDWRTRLPQVFAIRYKRLPASWRVWAERVVQCESGGNPYASNGTHFGRFQWLMSTWYAAGGHGSPTQTTYEQEALVAVSWARRVGVSQWACH